MASPTLAHLHRNLSHDLDSISVQSDHFARMVCQKPDGLQTEIGQDLGANSAFVLELALPVGCRQTAVIADARPILVEINQHACAFLDDPTKRIPNHLMALA